MTLLASWLDFALLVWFLSFLAIGLISVELIRMDIGEHICFAQAIVDFEVVSGSPDASQPPLT